MSLYPLVTKIKPQVIGIFWITDTSLMDIPRHFGELDYLLDGLLTGYIKRKQEMESIPTSEPKNFFVTESFGFPFFVAHLESKGNNLKEDVDQLMQLVSGLKTQRKEIWIVGPKDLEEIKYLKKNFKNYSFSHLSSLDN